MKKKGSILALVVALVLVLPLAAIALAQVSLIRANSAPTLEWDKTFGGKSEDWGWSVLQTSDGGYIIAGCTASYGAGWYDVWLVKTDSSGNKLWDKTFGLTELQGLTLTSQMVIGVFSPIHSLSAR